MEKKDLRLWTSTENLGKQEGRAGWDDLLLGGGQSILRVTSFLKVDSWADGSSKAGNTGEGVLCGVPDGGDLATLVG